MIIFYSGVVTFIILALIFLIREPRRTEIFPGSNKLIHDTIEYGLFLLIGPPGTGKTIFCKQFAFDSLKNGSPVVYLTTEESPGMIVESMKKFEWNVNIYARINKLRIIDAFSYRSNAPVKTRYYIENPENLTDLSVTIEEARKRITNLRFIMDSMTNLILNVDKNSGQKFMQVITGRLKAAKALGFCVLDAGVLDETFLNFLRIVFDGVIEMDITEDKSGLKRKMRIFSLKQGRHDSSWHEFKITNKGIEIL